MTNELIGVLENASLEVNVTIAESGPRGLQGEQGIQGPKGDKGDPGEKGDKGDTGAGAGLEFDWNGTQLGVRVEGQEDYVYVNLKGDKGEKGDIGPQGIQGPQGPKGDDGATGAIGPQGPKGDKGDKGDPGEQGPRGFSGVAVATSGMFAFNVTEDGYLTLSYTGDEAPDISIDEDGYLIWEY